MLLEQNLKITWHDFAVIVTATQNRACIVRKTVCSFVLERMTHCIKSKQTTELTRWVDSLYTSRCSETWWRGGHLGWLMSRGQAWD